MKRNYTWLVLVLVILFGVGCSAETPEGISEMEGTISEQATWMAMQATRLAALETEIAAQSDTDFRQWEAMSFLFTQMPYALGKITPVPPGVTITPTAYELREHPTWTPTPTPWTGTPEGWEYPPEARSGIFGVDQVIDAFLRGDVAARTALVRYVEYPCTTIDGLGGPPKCQEGEEDGAIVVAFPVSFGEGFFVRPEDIGQAFDFSVKGLMAVFYVPPEYSREDYWPAGDVGIVFSSEEGGYLHSVIVRVEGEEIVRLEYEPVWPPFGEQWGRGDSFVLEPMGP